MSEENEQEKNRENESTLPVVPSVPETSALNVSAAPARLPNGRFPPGVSANPKGHPKGKPNLVARYRSLCDRMARLPVPLSIANTKRGEVLKQIAGARIGGNFRNEEAVAAATIYAALTGEPWAIQQLVGRPDQNLDIKNTGEIIKNNIDISMLTSEQVEKITDAIISLDDKMSRD